MNIFIHIMNTINSTAVHTVITVVLGFLVRLPIALCNQSRDRSPGRADSHVPYVIGISCETLHFQYCNYVIDYSVLNSNMQ